MTLCQWQWDIALLLVMGICVIGISAQGNVLFQLKTQMVHKISAFAVAIHWLILITYIGLKCPYPTLAYPNYIYSEPVEKFHSKTSSIFFFAIDQSKYFL